MLKDEVRNNAYREKGEKEKRKCIVQAVKTLEQFGKGNALWHLNWET